MHTQESRSSPGPGSDPVPGADAACFSSRSRLVLAVGSPVQALVITTMSPIQSQRYTGSTDSAVAASAAFAPAVAADRSGSCSRRAFLALVATLAAIAPAPAAEAPAAPEDDPRFAVADTLRGEGQFEEARELYRTLRDEFTAAGQEAGQWRAQLGYADMARRAGDVDAARAAVEEAFSLAGDDPRRVAATRLGQCTLYSYLGESDAAIAECTAGLELAESIPDPLLEARGHFMLGTIHSRRARYALSVAETEKALALYRRHGGSRYDLAGALNSMGIEYAAVGRLGEAENMYREGLEIARTFSRPWYAAHLHSNLAYLRASVGDIQGAIDSTRESLLGAQATGNRQGVLYGHVALGEFYLDAGNLPAARRHLEKAVAIDAGVSNVFRVIALAMLGDLEAEEGRIGQARETLEEALALADASDYGLQAVNALASLTKVALGRGDPDAARRHSAEAVALAETLGSPEATITALEARARALEAAGGNDAPGAWLDTIDHLESLRGRLALGDLRMGVAEPRWNLYEGAIRTLLAAGRAAEAFDVSERARARLLLELLAERDASRPGASPVERLRRELRARFRERESAGTPERTEQLDAAIGELTAQLERMEADARTREPVTGAARFPRPAALAELQSGLVGLDRALLTFFWGERDVYGWLVTAEGVRAARLGAADALAARIDFLAAALERPSGGVPWSGPARAAFDALLEPLAAKLPGELLVVPDGPLARLPFEVLMPPGSAEPLGARARLRYGPSASVLLALAHAEKAGGWERSILVVGDPALGEGATPLASAGRDEPLGPLPYAAEEARTIHRLFRNERADLLLGARATLDAWHALEPARYRYLHFAAHARVDDRRPERTHLVLAGGRLDLFGIRALDLHTELVTLSACETGLGRRVRGEGVVGLSHAFLAAGARGTVVTLWRIEDAAAAEFMQDFYTKLSGNVAPAEALRQVRREWIASGAHPAHWAPFVLVGGSSGRPAAGGAPAGARQGELVIDGQAARR